MTLLAPALLSLGLAASPASSETSAPRGEPLKAPVEITVPAIVMKRPARPKAPTPSPDPRPAAPAPPPTETAKPIAPPAPAGNGVGAVASAAPVPVERRPGYDLVEQKCGRCHSMEKALNATFSADDWDGYLNRKYRRAGAGITAEQARAIGDFLRAWARQRLER